MPDRSRSSSSPGTTSKTLIVRVGHEQFGLPLPVVEEVLEIGQGGVTAVPGSPGWVAGIINYHGQVVPVIRIGGLLGLDVDAEGRQVVLVQLKNMRIGLMVDLIGSLEEVRAEGPSLQGRRRCWYRGALLELIDPDALHAEILKRLPRDVPT